MPRVGIALGSNLGNRLANLEAACDCLRQIADSGEPFLIAPIYQTEPMECPEGSPAFYNSVVEIEFTGTPSELLEKTQAIEKKLGRVAVPQRNAPRVIDVDLLYFGDVIVNTDGLILPHPRIGERRFVLQPLADIQPDLVLPGHHQSISRLLAKLGSDQ